MSGGSYIKIDASGIELGSSRNVTVKAIAMQKMGPATLTAPIPALPSPLSPITNRICLRCLIQAAEKGEMVIIAGGN